MLGLGTLALKRAPNWPAKALSFAAALAVALAEKGGHDLVMATDPDSDRMGVAVRNRAGKLELLTGNQVGALLARSFHTRGDEVGVVEKIASPDVKGTYQGLVIPRKLPGPNNTLVDAKPAYEAAMQNGWPVLLENIGETIDSFFEPVLQKKLVRSGGSWQA